MTGDKGRLAGRIILGGVIFSITLMAYAGSSIMLDQLFVAWYLPIGIALAFGVVSGIALLPFWRWLTSMPQPWINIGANIIVMTGVLLIALLFINNTCGEGEIRSEMGIVEKVYRETHYHSRRVSKGVYARGAPYYVYKGKIALSDGNMVDIRLKFKEYQALSKNDTLNVKIRRGYFGWEQVLTDSIKLPTEKKRKKTKSEVMIEWRKHHHPD